MFEQCVMTQLSPYKKNKTLKLLRYCLQQLHQHDNGIPFGPVKSKFWKQIVRTIKSVNQQQTQALGTDESPV